MAAPVAGFGGPDIELVLQVAIPFTGVTSEEADLEVRFGLGPYAGLQELRILSDEVVPACTKSRRCLNPFLSRTSRRAACNV